MVFDCYITVFSAYGHVASLNGQPETGVIVRALSRPDGEQCRGLGEEAVTENDGSFRIKGLHPGCSYDFAVRDKEEKFNKVAPERLTIAVSNDDITNVRFIAFRPLSGFELSGYVVTPVEFLPYIKVRFYVEVVTFLCIVVLYYLLLLKNFMFFTKRLCSFCIEIFRSFAKFF